MTIKIIIFHIVVVIFPILSTGVVRRVNVDCVYLTAMGEGQSFQRMEVLAVNYGMVGFVATPLYLSCADKARVDVVSNSATTTRSSAATCCASGSAAPIRSRCATLWLSTCSMLRTRQSR